MHPICADVRFIVVLFAMQLPPGRARNLPGWVAKQQELTLTPPNAVFQTMSQYQPLQLFQQPPRVNGQTHVLELRCEPLEQVRIAFIGLGMRMASTLKRFIHIEGARIQVICDIAPERIEQAQVLLNQYGMQAVDSYCGENDWRKVCERQDVDLVYISTHYDLHVPIAVYAMQCGKHTAIEVPAATSIEDCWKLVDTAETTRRHCMQLENCNYGEFEMATLNMVQQGLLGEIIHAEGAYIHDLKKLIFDTQQGYWNMWRLSYHEKKNGNLYPTHGLGPLCHALNIHRGDRLHYLTSMSSQAFHMKQYAAEHFGQQSAYALKDYRNGDINSSLIRSRNGKTILLQHDITSPRPYSRIHLLSGTKGFAQKWPRKGVSLAPNGMDYLSEDELHALLHKYEHPIRRQLKNKLEAFGQQVCAIAKNEGMDYIMDYRLIYCLRHGLPLDQDVYDAAEWSAIVELSEKSADNFSMPVEIPDFTRGDYQVLTKVKYHTAAIDEHTHAAEIQNDQQLLG